MILLQSGCFVSEALKKFGAARTGGKFVWACAKPLQAERANRIDRGNGGILRYGVTFLNLSSILPSPAIFLYHGKHLLLKIMIDSSRVFDRLWNKSTGWASFLLENDGSVSCPLYLTWVLHNIDPYLHYKAFHRAELRFSKSTIPLAFLSLPFPSLL